MMKLAVPATGQPWASTIAAPAASPAPCYEAPLNPPSKTIDYFLDSGVISFIRNSASRAILRLAVKCVYQWVVIVLIMVSPAHRR